MFNAYSVFNEPFNVVQGFTIPGYKVSTPGNECSTSYIAKSIIAIIIIIIIIIMHLFLVY